MMRTKARFQSPGVLGLILLGVGLLSGCPVPPDGNPDPQAEYDAGFLVGFARDSEYWRGFDDSYDTVDGGPIYYSGSEIPYLDELSYEAGYWDGTWYAYNDGYFVAYDYAFTIGFSEGYAAAFQPGWRSFLRNDQHIEWLDGGWTDGYNDGFSEGRVFGAWDWENGWPNDWLDAMLDYRGGTDLTIGGVSTGDAGPVYLYEYGTDPNDLVKVGKASGTGGPSLRSLGDAKAAIPDISYRSLPSSVQQEFNVKPDYSPRSTNPLGLSTTWLERINAYRSAIAGKASGTPRGG
jgi:hypothetical protein